MDAWEDHIGAALRRWRLRRGLTLGEAATLLATSAPVLSRKERGQDQVERSDVRLAIAVYGLDAWEAHQLWLLSGYSAESPLYQVREYSLHDVGELLLPHLRFPAFVTDDLAYLRAWNHGIELIWGPLTASGQRINILDDLFSASRRSQMGERWNSYILRALRIFRQKTQYLRSDPAYKQLLQTLVERHGHLFVEKWNEVEHGAGRQPLTLDTGAITIAHPSPVGRIDYLVTATTWQFPLPGEMTVYLPFGEENMARYAELAAAVDLSPIYYAEGPVKPGLAEGEPSA